MNIGSLSLENIEKFGEFDSLHFMGKSITNVEQNAYAGRLARVMLDRGVKPGDHVVLMMPNCPEVLASFQACWKIGAVPIPITPMLNAREVGYVIENSESKFALTVPVLAGRLREASERIEGFKGLLVVGEPKNVEGAVDISADIAQADPVTTLAQVASDDICMLLYTSGTTGHPKGVMLTHGNLMENGRAVAVRATSVQPFMPTLHVLPLSHSFGVLMMNLGYILGSRSSLLTHWDTESVFKTIEEHKVERFSIVPTMLTYMLNFPDREKFDVSTLMQVNTGGAALMNEIRMDFEREFDCVVKEGYGLSETSPTLTGYHDEDDYRPGSVGNAIPGVEIAILDFDNNPVPLGEQGEICARGPNIMKGYWKLPEATDEAMAGGWFHSGDIGYMDEDGYVYITDRKKDLIIKGGENISPREIEEGLQEHPAVAEAAVIGVKDPTYGENIVAVVSLKPGAEATEDELKEHAGKYVTKFKIPARVVFSTLLPKN
ncbi:MAG: AMP-binding protein, partial [Rhodothermales bacterium]|nr:AMP-binding protein [Rhodothermales bacterium]